ncbi:MAG: hypothetical protein ACI9EB_000405 [Pseudomonas sp.]|jgi:hypothetical protein
MSNQAAKAAIAELEQLADDLQKVHGAFPGTTPELIGWLLKQMKRMHELNVPRNQQNQMLDDAYLQKMREA